jgi:hypothetical protein
LAGSIMADPFIEIAPVGHTSRQSAQPMHSSSSTIAVTPCGLTASRPSILRLISSNRCLTRPTRCLSKPRSSSSSSPGGSAGTAVNLPLPGQLMNLFGCGLLRPSRSLLLTFQLSSKGLIIYLSLGHHHLCTEKLCVCGALHGKWCPSKWKITSLLPLQNPGFIMRLQ